MRHCAGYNNLIDPFLDGNSTPIINALISEEKMEAKRTLCKRYITSNPYDIELALSEEGEAAAHRVALAESRRHFLPIKEEKKLLENAFVDIKLGKHKEPVALNGHCFWVPASVRHEVKKDETSGLTRYSFFVYGGVNVQPRINQINGVNGALRGNAVGGGFSNVNAQVAMNQKMRILERAQNAAVKTVQLNDGRIRYYAEERASRTPGPTRGNAHVTEYNTKTGQVREWAESYNHQGNVNRVHNKTIDGQMQRAPHYPPTGAEIRQKGGLK